MSGPVEIGNTRALFSANLAGVQRKAVLVAVVGIGFTILGLFTNREQFFISYLSAWLFWGGLPLGFLVLHLLHNSTGGRWGRPIRPYLEAGSGTVPWMAPFFLPVLFGIHTLYSWTRPEVQAELEGWETKSHYLNIKAWMIRAAVFFAIWILYSIILKRWNTPRARRGEEEHGRLTTTSCIGLVVFFITVSFSAIDWYMSVQPSWFSSMFGVITIVGEGLSAFAFMVIFTYRLMGQDARSVVPVSALHDLGNFLLMSVMLWAYTSFSQYLLIWSAQLPHETSWLITRSKGSWGWIGFFLIVIHFFIPFFFLLFRSITKNYGRLYRVAVLIFAIHMIHDIWVIGPAFHPEGPPLRWMDVATFAALGGVFVALFVGQLRSLAPHFSGEGTHPAGSPSGSSDVKTRGISAPQDKPGHLKPAGI